MLVKATLCPALKVNEHRKNAKQPLFTTCGGFSFVSSSVCVLLSLPAFANKSGVEKQKRKHRKYCVTVRPQSEKYHTKPRVMAMERRHIYIFFFFFFFFTLQLALSARISRFEQVCVAHSQGRFVHPHLRHRQGDAVSSKQEAKRRKNSELYEAAESGAVIGCGRSARVCCWLWREAIYRLQLYLTAEGLSVRQSVCLSVCMYGLYIYMSVRPSVCLYGLYIYMSVCPSVCLSVCMAYISTCLSVRLSVCMAYISTCLSVCLCIYISVCLSVCLSIYLSVCLSVYLCICLSVCLSMYLPVCLSICLSIYLSIYLSVCLSVCLLGTFHHCRSHRSTVNCCTEVFLPPFWLTVILRSWHHIISPLRSLFWITENRWD